MIFIYFSANLTPIYLFFIEGQTMSANRKTIVVKFGTSTLTHGSPKLNAPHMVDIVRQIAQLHQAGFVS